MVVDEVVVGGAEQREVVEVGTDDAADDRRVDDLVALKSESVMDDDELAAMVARDLRSNLERRAEQEWDVYGVGLWAGDDYGYFLISLGTGELAERLAALPAYTGPNAAKLDGPAGDRWNIGDWHRFPDDEFLTSETTAALRPLASRLSDDDLDLEVVVAEAARWREIGFKALEAARPLDVLPTTEDAIAFVACPDITTVEQAVMMQRTVPPGQFHAVFPEWRRLARLVRSVQADTATMEELRRLFTEERFFDEPSGIDEELKLTLKRCGFYWGSIVQNSDALHTAFAIAEWS